MLSHTTGHLSLAFRAHINVEYCGWSMMIKYLFKYISKGVDPIRARITRPLGECPNATIEKKKTDEIQNSVNARYICPHEAAQRIFSFDIHELNPAVQVLAVHLEMMQTITMLLAHQVGCKTFADIRTVGGVRFPNYRSACEAFGLLGDDKEWAYAFDEAYE
ncbi:hypothetical protein Tco_1520789 [Tanacetum coccineum]